jgi:hypothetical protein
LNFPGLSIGTGAACEFELGAEGATEDPEDEPRTREGTVLAADLLGAVTGELEVEAVEGVRRLGDWTVWCEAV